MQMSEKFYRYFRDSLPHSGSEDACTNTLYISVRYCTVLCNNTNLSLLLDKKGTSAMWCSSCV